MCFLLTQQNKAEMIQGEEGQNNIREKKNMTSEPVPPAWKASIQTTRPLNHC